MGWQQFGEKKIRRLSELCGVNLAMVWNHQGVDAHTWVEARTEDDRHLLVNKKTGEIDWMPDDRVVHFSSCPSSGRDLGDPT